MADDAVWAVPANALDVNIGPNPCPPCLHFQVTCSRCPAEIAIPPRLKRRGLRDTEKIKCPKCGHADCDCTRLPPNAIEC